MTCAPTATRTRDLLLRRQSLYPLSYRGPTAKPTGQNRPTQPRPDRPAHAATAARFAAFVQLIRALWLGGGDMKPGSQYPLTC